jgi:uncharacterized coiled-coil protein SlyX
MKKPIKLTTKKVSPARNSVSHSLSLITSHYSLLAVLLLALSPAPKAFGVTPAPDGGYPGGNTAEGQNALQNLTSGTNNTALGSQALYHDTTGSNNAATGLRALYSNIAGVSNTATGSQALLNNTTGNQNTANGYVALSSNTSGVSNTATGSGALHSNTSASHNTATGYIALYRNTTGTQNTATGDRSLYSNTTGSYNTANGYQALNSNTVDANTATGFGALYRSTTGPDNTATGYLALNGNDTGFENTANGFGALSGNTTGAYNIAIGYNAGFFVTGNGNICIGSDAYGVGGEDATTRIGNIYASVASGRAVYVNSDNKLGTLASSRRFKDQIKPMDKASETVLALRPVTFRYKKEIEPNGAVQFGLIAEEVEKVNPDLVVRDAHGEPYSVRYEAVNAMLLNEFLKEYRTVKEQETAISQLKSATAKQEATIAKQQKEIEALTTGLQKVSDQLELSKSAPQMAGNNR